MDNELEPVLAWLEAGDAGDYDAGLLLLGQHGRNRHLVQQLGRRESVLNREKLRYELIKVSCEGRMDDVNEAVSHFAAAVQGAVPAIAAFAAAAVAIEPEQPAPAVVPAERQAEVNELTVLMSQLYNQKAKLSNTLGDVSEAEAPGVVAQVLDLQKQYNALAEKRKLTAAGQPTAAPADEVPADEPKATVVELMTQRTNLRSRVSKAKAAADKAPNDVLKAEKLAKLQVELNALDLTIKAGAA